MCAPRSPGCPGRAASPRRCASLPACPARACIASTRCLAALPAPPPVTAPLLAACLQARRRLLVIAYYMAIVSLLTLFGVLIVPDVVREGADFVSRLQTENLWVVVLEKMRKGLG